MRSLILALLVGVSYASYLAPVQAVAQEAAARTVDVSPYKLVEQDQRFGLNRQQMAGPTRWVAIVNVAESTAIPVATGAGSGATTPAGTPVVQGTTTTLEGTQKVINAGWVKPNGGECPCGPDCRCIDPSICKAGDCKRNFIVLFSADWCRFCPKQKAIVEKLAQEGYIVYIVDSDTHRKAVEELKVNTLPTTLVFENGKEVARYIGITRIEQVKSGVKKRVDQKDPPAPAPDPYSFK